MRMLRQYLAASADTVCRRQIPPLAVLIALAVTITVGWLLGMTGQAVTRLAAQPPSARNDAAVPLHATPASDRIWR